MYSSISETVLLKQASLVLFYENYTYQQLQVGVVP